MKIDISDVQYTFPEEGRDTETVLQEISDNTKKWFRTLRSGQKDFTGSEYTGWVSLPEEIDEGLIEDLIRTAEEIRNQCTLLIVIGIGGSYLGAKAVIDALNGPKVGWPEVIFAGFNMSAAYHEKLLRRVNSESTCICVISKSGRTVEPLLVYSILKDKMFAKYGYQEARRRIYVITDAEEGDLRPDAIENGFKTFEVPGDIGGRYSVLTSVGLLPIAAAGYDIRALLQGALAMSKESSWEDELLQYASFRIAMQLCGKQVEVFEYFEANLNYFGQWLVQLFGESEGKEGKGAFPTCLWFSRDLHSMGQFLQQGSQIFYETMISVAKSNTDVLIPWYAGYPYAGKKMEQINECSEKGVLIAHRKAGNPVICLEIDALDEFNLGQLIYFFEISAAVSGFCLGVNPFNQPGVELYKEEMRKLVEQL